MRPTLWLAILFALAGVERSCAQAPDLFGQDISRIHGTTLGKLIRDSDRIVVLEVEKAIKERNLIIFKLVAALKGKAEAGPVRHYRFRGPVFEWATPGKTALVFFLGDKAVTCLDNHWYCNWSRHKHDPSAWVCAEWVDELLSCYAGSAEKLREHVSAILAGQEVVIAARMREERKEEAPSSDDDEASPIDLDWLRGKRGRVWRIKASLKINTPVESETSRYFVGWGIGGPEVVPSLVANLKGKDPWVRAAAAEDLGQLGANARAAFPVLCSALNDPDGFVRVYAAEALSRIDPRRPVDMPILLEALKDKDFELRLASVTALAELGPRAAPAAEKLLPVLGDQQAWVRRVAAYALGRIDSNAIRPASLRREVVMALATVLRFDTDDKCRLWAAKALLTYGPDARFVIPSLKVALRDSVCAKIAANALARLGPVAAPALEGALLDERCLVSCEACQYLGEMGPSARTAIPVLIGALKENDPALRCAAATALLRLDRELGVKLAVPVLCEIAEREEEGLPLIGVLRDLGPYQEITVRMAAANALCRVVWDSTELPQEEPLPWARLSLKELEVFYSDLQTEDPREVYRSLGTLILAGNQSVSFLEKRLHPIQPVESQKITRLVADLESDNFAIRQSATTELGKAERQAEPALRQLLAGQHSVEGRRRAERLLSRLDRTKCPERMQLWLALQALEHIGTPEARKLLASLAAGAPAAQLTEEAKAALGRLNH
jgi:HEAT repeat protein